MRLARAVFLVLVGCGGSAASIAASDGGGVLNEPRPDASIEADADVDVQAEHDDARPEAGDDAERDGATDASIDGPFADAPNDTSADAGSDAAIDSGPPQCTVGDNRCTSYRYETCSATHTWEWSVGDQSCCHDARWSLVGNRVTDAMTGLHWDRFGGRCALAGGCGATLCDFHGVGARVPTTAELLAITIGPPYMNKSVCSPTVDQSAFANVYAGQTWTSDGCVDLIRATSLAACDDATPGFVCIVP